MDATEWFRDGCDHGTVVLTLDSDGNAAVLCALCQGTWTVPLSTPISDVIRDVFAEVDR